MSAAHENVMFLQIHAHINWCELFVSRKQIVDAAAADSIAWL